MACGKLDPRSGDEVVLCNDLDEAVLATVALPEGAPPPGGWPGVLLLHGSGGLHATNDDGTCSVELQEQFQHWAELLTARGYAVVMPDSFMSRGFCDWDDDARDASGLDKQERLVLRTFDAAAAANYLCDDPRVDCSRLAAIGFSNGASTLLMLYHEDHGDCRDARLHALTDVPDFVGGVAYYPGCGLDEQLATSLDHEDAERFYFPRAPLWVPHGSKDGLLDDCEELRDPQVDSVAERRGVTADLFQLQIYDGAKHGFDDLDSDSDANQYARADAEAMTLDMLDGWF